MKHLDNWGHVYGIIFKEFNYDTFIKSLIQSKNRKESFNLDNEEQELIFISEYKKYADGYCFLIGRTNEEVSKTKFDTKTFVSEEIRFKDNEHISDYTHIFISKNNTSSLKNSHYLLVEKNQRIQIGTIKKLIGNIIGYKAFDKEDSPQLFIGSILQSNYVKKLIEQEIIGKKIIINQNNENLLDFPSDDKDDTITTVTQISKYDTSAKFLNALRFLMNDKKNTKNREIFLIVDDGKTNNKKIPFESDSSKFVPFFDLPFYIKSRNREINEKIASKFILVTNSKDYESE